MSSHPNEHSPNSLHVPVDFQEISRICARAVAESPWPPPLRPCRLPLIKPLSAPPQRAYCAPLPCPPPPVSGLLTTPLHGWRQLTRITSHTPDHTAGQPGRRSTYTASRHHPRGTPFPFFASLVSDTFSANHSKSVNSTPLPIKTPSPPPLTKHKLDHLAPADPIEHLATCLILVLASD